jgi:hypothetical protein
VSDSNTHRYQADRSGPRFIIEQAIVVRSENARDAAGGQ